MKTSVVDLSLSGQGQDAGAPDQKAIVCKFMLITASEIVHLVFGPVSEFGYHANLIDRFCSVQGLAAMWARKPDRVEILEPGVDHSGGGWLKIHHSGSSFEFYGGSTAYGKFDLETVRNVVDNEPYFANKRIRIR